MAGSFYGFRQFSLMTGAGSGSFFRPDFGQARNQPFQKVGILKVNFFDIALTEITRHVCLI